MKIFLFVFFSIILFSNDNIKRDFDEYLDNYNSGEGEKAVEFVHEKFFDLMPKEKMIEQFNKAKNNPNDNFETTGIEYISFSEEFTSDGKTFVVVNYLNLTAIKKESDDIDAETNKLKQKYKVKEVGFDSEKNVFKLKIPKKVIAVSKDGESWKFITYEKGLDFLVKGMVPEQVYLEVNK